ncbi:MAG: hypothetical protein ACREP9_15795 [Candidatus Dormibacteraceae bacterium]
MVSEQGNDPAEVVARKIEEMNKVIKAGRSEEKLAAVTAEMKSAGMSEEDINALLSAAAASYLTEDSNGQL